jgi:hypothetical protein
MYWVKKYMKELKCFVSQKNKIGRLYGGRYNMIETMCLMSEYIAQLDPHVLQLFNMELDPKVEDVHFKKMRVCKKKKNEQGV